MGLLASSWESALDQRASWCSGWRILLLAFQATLSGRVSAQREDFFLFLSFYLTIVSLSHPTINNSLISFNASSYSHFSFKSQIAFLQLGLF